MPVDLNALFAIRETVIRQVDEVVLEATRGLIRKDGTAAPI